METFQELEHTIHACERCPRLRSYCEQIARVKKREFRADAYWGRPVSGFGDPKAAIWIIGLAPAAHGANRTGRMFTGDSSGNWLFAALHAVGLANQPTSTHRNDGLKLRSVFISAAARCAPPDNKPLPEEIQNCAGYLDTEWALLRRRKLILALGAISLKAIYTLGKRHGVAPARAPKFGHGILHEWGRERILCSYHPSRQNTQTGRLTREMWNAVFERAISLI